MTRTDDVVRGKTEAPPCITGRCPACSGRNFELVAVSPNLKTYLFRCRLCGNEFFDGSEDVPSLGLAQARREIARRMAGFFSLVRTLVVGGARVCAMLVFSPLALLGIVLALGGADEASWKVLDLWGWLVGRREEAKR